MRKFVNKVTFPPNGYKYTCPETGDLLHGGDFRQLVAMVRQYRERAGLPCPPDLPELIEHNVCNNNPDDFCVGNLEPGDAPAKRISANEVREATRVRLKWPVEKVVVSQGEADRRAKICASCPSNIKGFCVSCDGLTASIREVIGSRKTIYDSSLGLCTHCACLLAAKCWVSSEAIRAGKRPTNLSEYPGGCWVHGVWGEG